MTQTAPQSLGSGCVSAPFPSPPGLELGPVANEAGSNAARSPIGSQLGGIGQSVGAASGENRTEVVEAVRRILLRDVDSKVSEKVEELWNRGKTMLSQVHQRQQKKADELSSEISRCLEKQRTLEAENEQLKQVLTGLAARLAMLGGAPGCHVGTPDATTTAGGSSVASASPPHTNGNSESIFSPGAGAAVSNDSFATPLPEVPAFPFPAASPAVATAAPLSLAEALGPTASPMQTQAHMGGPMPLSLASSLPPSPLETSSPFAAAGVPSVPQVFSFTLRKADETDLGLNVSQHEVDKVLCVEGVRSDGAVDAWNRQCMGGAFSEKAVMRGDRIVSVNNISYDPEKMLEECKEKQLLRLTLVRGDVPLPDLSQAAGGTGAGGPPPGFGSPGKSTSLRADACEFVPMSAAAARDEAKAESAVAS